MNFSISKFLFFNIISLIIPVAKGNEEYFCNSKSHDAIDPALLKTYPESVIQIAKGCFRHAYNLSLQPEITQTSDNIYIKLMHLVNETTQQKSSDTKPILFLHGLLATSSVWLLNQQSTDLIFQLYQSNYDIWLGNERSNYFSVNKHHSATLGEDDDDVAAAAAAAAGAASYWNYSWHEVGLKDLPAMIDYVLNATNSKKLRIVCHSQGCTTFFVMASLLPEYADKIAIVYALAPAVYLKRSKSPLISMATGFFKNFKAPFNYPVGMSFRQLCLSSEFMLKRCIEFYYRICGQSVEPLNETLIPIYLYNYPTISSLREHMHFYQLHKTGKFTPFDEGFWTEGESNNPIEYPLENIKTPIALYYCDNDLLVDVEDIEHLITRLPNLKESHLLNECNHMDLVIAKDIGQIIYESIIKLENFI